MMLREKLSVTLLSLGLIFFLMSSELSAASRSSGSNTLQKIRVADYTDFSRITLEFSQMISYSVSKGKNYIQVRLVGVNPGHYNKPVEAFDSVAFNTITFRKDRSSNVLTLFIPVLSNVDLEKIHHDRWTDMITIDMPFKTPNHTLIPSEQEILQAKRNGQKVIIIDPGHGGFNTNAIGSRYCKRPHLVESEMALDVGIRLYNLLKSDPRFLPIMTRYGDYLPAPFGVEGSTRNAYKDYALLNRVRLAQQYQGDLFLSLHFNAPPRNTSPLKPRGFEVYYMGESSAAWLQKYYHRKYDSERIQIMGINRRNDSNFSNIPPQNKDLALLVTEEVKRSIPQLPMRARTQKSTVNFMVLRHINMPSVLIEMGFITHPSDHEIIRSVSNRQNFASSFHKALDKFFFTNSSDLDQLLIALKSTPNTSSVPDETRVIADLGVDAEDPSDLDALRDQLKEETEFDRVSDTGVKENKQDITKTTTDTTTDTPSYHTVRGGESLHTIAKQYGTTDTLLRQLNQEIVGRRNIIHPGDKLRLPSDDIESSQTVAVTTPQVYTVRRGDTLEKIALMFKLTTQELKSYNRKRSHMIYPGDEIKIPSSAPAVLTHYVKTGETLGIIAKEYGLSVNKLKQLNNKKSNLIFPGDQLQVPVSTGTSTQYAQPSFIEYRVQKNDSLWKIAQRFNTTVNVIKQANNLRSSRLQPGMMLQIPAQ